MVDGNAEINVHCPTHINCHNGQVRAWTPEMESGMEPKSTTRGQVTSRDQNDEQYGVQYMYMYGHMSTMHLKTRLNAVSPRLCALGLVCENWRAELDFSSMSS